MRLNKLFILRIGSKSRSRRKNYEPVQWNPYFDCAKDIQVGQNIFHVYVKGNEGPLLVLLHGGGYSGLTWAELTVSKMSTNDILIIEINLYYKF
jgi:protein phosphatase methylesterase 1